MHNGRVMRPTMALVLWRLCLGVYTTQQEVLDDIASVTCRIFYLRYGGVFPEHVVKAALEATWQPGLQDVFSIQSLPDVTAALYEYDS